MTRLYLTVLLVIVAGVQHLFGQITISGIVQDKSGEPILGSNVYLEGAYDGASSNVEGQFSFSTDEQGTLVLIASFIGYEEFRQEVKIDGEDLITSITLIESINRMAAVVISAGSFSASGESKSEVLRPLDIVTTAGATADIPGALNTLPGTQTVGEEGRLFVRGGDSYETTTFIDGMMVLDSYDPTVPNVPTRSRFSPMMFKGVSFSTGGYSAEYGQALSSALILNAKDKAEQDRTDFSIMTVGLEAAQTKAWDNSSLAAKVGYINLGPYFNLVEQDLNWSTPPRSLDGNIAFRMNTSQSGLLKMYGKFNFSDMQTDYIPVDSTGIVETRIQNQYGYLNANYRDMIADRWTIKSGLSYTYTNDNITPDSSKVKERLEGLHAKVVLGHDLTKHVVVNFGSDLLKRDHLQEIRDQEEVPLQKITFEEWIASSFLETDIYFTNNFLARIGGRLEYSTLNDEISVDPRISFAYKTSDKSQISLAYGKFRQVAPKELVRINKQLDPEKASHFILNYQVMKDSRTFRIEGYWKRYHDLVKYDPNARYQPASYTNSGNGYARGIDLFWRDNRSFSNVDYWISYSFLDSERDYRDYPYAAVPTFTSMHNISVVYKHFISAIRSQVGFTYSFTSGRPYNDPNLDSFTSERTIPYSDLSGNISYLMKQNVIVYVSLTNILGRENVFGYEYQSFQNPDGVYAGRPVTLPAPRFYFIGLFITLSEDGLVNRLPNL